jgi:hypothetical protein
MPTLSPLPMKLKPVTSNTECTPSIWRTCWLTPFMNSRVRGWLVPGGIMTTPMVNPWSSSGTKLLGTNRKVTTPAAISSTKPTDQATLWRTPNRTARRYECWVLS